MMNDKFTNSTQDENENIALYLSDAADQAKPTPYFTAELEAKIRQVHKPKTNWLHPTFKQVVPVVGWTALLIAFAFLFTWSIRNIVPKPQPAANVTPTGHLCPVTEPNGSVPPGEQQGDYFLGNGELWAGLWPDGKVNMLPDNREPDGSFSMKWWWWRGVNGALTIEGHRLDAKANPLRADIPEGYGDTGFQVAALIFPTTGCWEVTGHVGESSLTFVTEVVYGEATPTPDLSLGINGTPQPNGTPVSNSEGYNWRDTKLYLNVPLPDAPTEANIYLLKEEQSATVEQAQALAQQLGIQGQVYVSENLITHTTDYLVTDGKQSLTMTTDRFYTYTADMSKAVYFLESSTHPNAESIINDFLQSHGFNFPHKITKGDLFGGYMVEPLSPDGFPMRYEFFSSRPMRVILDENGQVLQIEANLMEYEPVGTQAFGIITAEEAFQNIMDDAITDGKIESALSAPMETQQWIREYPENETLTLYGYASSVPALDPAQPAFVQIDGFTLTGSSGGMEALERNTFVKATGQFITENGVKKFNIESWQVSGPIQEGLVGTLTSENGQVIFQTEEGDRLVIQPEIPADIPLPFENAFVVGVRTEDTYYWTLIDNRMTMGGGGGGGGGTGFYKLNLSGTPVPFSSTSLVPSAGDGTYIVQAGDTLTSIAGAYNITLDELLQANSLPLDSIIFVGQQLIIPGVSSLQSEIGKKIEGQRGFVNVTIYNQPDGSQQAEYLLSYISEDDSHTYMMTLTGDNLEELQAYQNRPVEIWGTIEDYDERYAMPTVNVEHFEIPFPDLQFQILRGQQQVSEMNGQRVLLFIAEDGTTYVQITPTIDVVNFLLGREGDPVLLETLSVPDETINGYPTLHVFSSAMATSPKNGEPVELTITADQIYAYDQDPFSPVTYVPPALTIEKVELMYYVTNPHWQVDHLDGSPLYIQPVWHFYGHYENGGEFDVIIQALKKEFLLPELAPYIQGG